MAPLQNLDFKELTSKIFKLNDLLPHGALQILHFSFSARRASVHIGTIFDVRSGFWALKFQVSGCPIETLHEL
jgi:hypothetical protein